MSYCPQRFNLSQAPSDPRLLLQTSILLSGGIGIGYLTVQNWKISMGLLVVGTLVVGGIVAISKQGLYRLNMNCLFLSLPLISALVIDIGASVRSTYIFAIAALIFGLYHGALTRPDRTPAFYWLFAFLLISLMSIGLTMRIPDLSAQSGSGLRGLSLRAAIQNGQLFLMAAIMYLTVTYCSSLSRFRKALELIWWATLFAAAYGIYEFVAQAVDVPFIYINNAVNHHNEYTYNPVWTTIGDIYVPRPFSTFDEPKNFANYLLIATILSICSLVCERSSRKRFLILTTIVLAGVAFVLANSRGAWIALAIALLAATLYRRDIRLVLKGILWVGGLLIMVYYLLLPTFFPEFNVSDVSVMFEQRLHDTLELEGRKTAWEPALEIFAEHPVLGVGFGNLTFYMPENSNQVVDVPSLYLRLLAELGVVGLLAFLLFIGSVLWALLKIRDRARFDATLFVFCTGLFSAVLGDLVQRASFVGIATDAYLWVLWGLAISIVRIVRTETRLGKVPQLVVPAG